MRILVMTVVIGAALALSWPLSAALADDSKLKDATRQVESGGKAIGSGIEETAKGVGNTVAEGAKTVGKQVKTAGKAAEPEAKTAWQHVRDGAVSFGQSVKNFFSGLGGN
jgi:hypothetical protein